MSSSPKVLYVLIALFCIFAIIAGIYAQFIETKPENKQTPDNGVNTMTKPNQATIKAEFNNIFTSVFNANGYDTTGIAKIKSDNDAVVYTIYKMTETKGGYEIDVNIPLVNIKSEVAKSFNNRTQATFVNKINEIRGENDATKKTIYSVDYVAYINGDILSVAIKSTLKEGDNAQRVIMQTYNYNLTTGNALTLNDLITRKMLNKDEVNSKIIQVVKDAAIDEKAIENMGYNTSFSRNLNDTMYTVDNTGTFFLGDNNKLYIIYAYGNQHFTSEMDIIVFE